MPRFQSAYRHHHSTEMALLWIISDIVGAVDRSSVTLLGLFDLNAAFDTVDHTILLDRLQIRFGVGGGVLEWIRTFLVGRTQQVLYIWVGCHPSVDWISAFRRVRFSSFSFSCCSLPSCSKSSTERQHTHTLMIRRCISVYQPPNHQLQLGSFRSASRRSTVGCRQTDSKWTPTKPIWFGSERASSCQRLTSMRSNCSWTWYRSPHLCRTWAWFSTI